MGRGGIMLPGVLFHWRLPIFFTKFDKTFKLNLPNGGVKMNRIGMTAFIIAVSYKISEKQINNFSHIKQSLQLFFGLDCQLSICSFQCQHLYGTLFLEVAQSKKILFFCATWNKFALYLVQIQHHIIIFFCRNCTF